MFVGPWPKTWSGTPLAHLAFASTLHGATARVGSADRRRRHTGPRAADQLRAVPPYNYRTILVQARPRRRLRLEEQRSIAQVAFVSSMEGALQTEQISILEGSLCLDSTVTLRHLCRCPVISCRRVAWLCVFKHVHMLLLLASITVQSRCPFPLYPYT